MQIYAVIVDEARLKCLEKPSTSSQERQWRTWKITRGQLLIILIRGRRPRSLEENELMKPKTQLIITNLFAFSSTKKKRRPAQAHTEIKDEKFFLINFWNIFPARASLSLFVLPLDRIEIAFEADFIDINSIISSISLNWFLLRKEEKEPARARLVSSFSLLFLFILALAASRANEQFAIISAFLSSPVIRIQDVMIEQHVRIEAGKGHGRRQRWNVVTKLESIAWPQHKPARCSAAEREQKARR